MVSLAPFLLLRAGKQRAASRKKEEGKSSPQSSFLCLLLALCTGQQSRRSAILRPKWTTICRRPPLTTTGSRATSSERRAKSNEQISKHTHSSRNNNLDPFHFISAPNWRQRPAHCGRTQSPASGTYFTYRNQIKIDSDAQWAPQAQERQAHQLGSAIGAPTRQAQSEANLGQSEAQFLAGA